MNGEQFFEHQGNVVSSFFRHGGFQFSGSVILPPQSFLGESFQKSLIAWSSVGAHNEFPNKMHSGLSHVAHHPGGPVFSLNVEMNWLQCGHLESISPPPPRPVPLCFLLPIPTQRPGAVG
jgi:hypothetical protein